jgi:hypothetical protein
MIPGKLQQWQCGRTFTVAPTFKLSIPWRNLLNFADGLHRTLLWTPVKFNKPEVHSS